MDINYIIFLISILVIIINSFLIYKNWYRNPLSYTTDGEIHNEINELIKNLENKFTNSGNK